MLIYALLLACVLAGNLFSVIMKLAERAGHNVLATGAVNYIVASLVCAGASAVTVGFHASTSTILLGTLNGLLFITSYTILSRALRSAGVAIPQIVARSSVILPTLVCVCAFNELLSTLQWTGVVLLLFAFPFVGTRAIEYRSIPRGRAAALLLMLFVLAGGQTVIIKIFVESGASQERLLFLLCIFGVGAVAGLTAIAAGRIPCRAGEIRMGTVLGLCNLVANLPLLFVLERMSGALAFPMMSGGGVVLAVLITWGVLHERLRTRSVVGAALAAAALFLLKLGS